MNEVSASSKIRALNSGRGEPHLEMVLLLILAVFMAVLKYMEAALPDVPSLAGRHEF